MTSRSRRFLLLAALAASACVSTPRDPFAAACRAQQRGDLLQALLGFDAVPVAHPSYPEARSAAAQVERRLRDSQELLLHGMQLRAEWRDTEAVAVFERARALWPRLQGVDELLEATRRRQSLLPADELQPLDSGAKQLTAAELMALAAPLAETAATVPPALPAAPEVRGGQPAATGPEEIVAPADDPVAAPPTGLAGTNSDPASTVATGGVVAPAADRVAVRLTAVEQRLQRGELDATLTELVALRTEYPDDSRVRVRLSRVLHQRALRSYGQGELRAAVRDWQHAVATDPTEPNLRQLLEAAQQELLGLDRR